MKWKSPVCLRNIAIVTLFVTGGILSSYGGEGSRAARMGYQPDAVPAGIPRMDASRASAPAGSLRQSAPVPCPRCNATRR